MNKKTIIKTTILAMMLTLMFTFTVSAAACKTHTFAAWTTTQTATCTGTGAMRRICKKCGYVEKKTVAKLGHNTFTIVFSYPTCQKQGKKETVCKRCGKLINTIYTPKVDHKYIGYRATTSAERKKYGWASISFCKYCGKARGSVASY